MRAILLVFFCLLPFWVQGEVKRKNILFISVDDMNTDISIYGVDQVKTPNLERLAQMGVRFDRAYCQQALCGPSRISVMTGLRPDTTGCKRLHDNFRDKNEDLVTLSQFFKNRGYYSARVGKIYHYNNPGQIGSNGNDDPLSWTERYNPVGIDKTRESEITVYPESRKGKGLGISMAWWDPVSEDSDHTDGKVADKVIELIGKHKEEPFFIAAGFFNPHCPYVAPRKYFDLYDIDEMTMPDLDEARNQLLDVPDMAWKRDRKGWPYYFKGVTVDQAKQCKLAYYATISFLDAQIGKLLDALEENDLMENTLIVFWSDHGYFLGEKGLWYKRKNFERSVRVPLLIAGPGVRENILSSHTVELLDLYPTLVDMTDYRIPTNLEGQSLRPILEQRDFDWDKPAISQVFLNGESQGYSIRNERWRYTEWNHGKAGVELYDHSMDPNEVMNLSKEKEFGSIRKELSEQLRSILNKKNSL